MNLRVYLRLFRPVCSLTVTVIYTMTAAGEGYLFHLDFKAERFLACAVALPLLLGVSLAGAVHEPMHRSFILLLPNATHVLRRVTVAALSVFAVFVTLVTALVDPAIPPPATFGLACALLALPCIDRHKHLFGFGGMVAAFAAWLLMNAFIGAILPAAMTAAPSAFCAGGIAISIAAIAIGFSRATLRERIEFYWCSMAGCFALIFDRQTTARHRREWRLSLERRGSRTVKRGRDWSVHSVGNSTVEWMRVLLHGFLGRQRNGSFFRALLYFAGMLALYIFGMPFLFRLLGHLVPKLPAPPAYWETLAHFTGPISTPGHNLPLTMITMMALLQPGFAGILATSIIRPQVPYPISRERIARTVFGLSLLQLGVALLIPGTVLFLASLLGQFLSGRIAADYGLHSVVGIDLMLAVSLPLLSCSGTFKQSAARLLWSILIGATITVAAVLRDHWIPAALTVPGLLIAMLSIAGAIGLLWLSLQRQYRAHDLLFEPGPLGIAPT